MDSFKNNPTSKVNVYWEYLWKNYESKIKIWISSSIGTSLTGYLRTEVLVINIIIGFNYKSYLIRGKSNYFSNIRLLCYFVQICLHPTDHIKTCMVLPYKTIIIYFTIIKLTYSMFYFPFNIITFTYNYKMIE